MKTKMKITMTSSFTVALIACSATCFAGGESCETLFASDTPYREKIVPVGVKPTTLWETGKVDETLFYLFEDKVVIDGAYLASEKRTSEIKSTKPWQRRGGAEFEIKNARNIVIDRENKIVVIEGDEPAVFLYANGWYRSGLLHNKAAGIFWIVEVPFTLSSLTVRYDKIIRVVANKIEVLGTFNLPPRTIGMWEKFIHGVWGVPQAPFTDVSLSGDNSSVYLKSARGTRTFKLNPPASDQEASRVLRGFGKGQYQP